MEKLFIIVPAYNEAENIAKFVEDWYPVIKKHNAGKQSRLVIINDGSRDSTFKILKSLSQKYELLEPLDKANEGHGATVLFGYRYALRHGAEYIFQTDSDGQTNPGEFEAFWKRRHSYDVVFGNRTHREDGAARILVERTLCLLLKYYFGVSIPDANAPFRLMSASYLREFLPKIPDHYNLPNVMLTTFGVYYHKKVKFIPITFRPRQGGTNSVNMKKIVRIGLQALKDFRMIRKGM